MAMKIDRDAIRELAEILNETGLTEIEVEEKDMKVRVAKGGMQQMSYAAPAMAMAPAAAAPVEAVAEPVVADASHPGAVKSPMVGTAYHAPEPGAAPFIEIGKKISAGDTVMIIEAMKVMNPIKAEKSGTITKILADDASPVEFGDVLVIIE